MKRILIFFILCIAIISYYGCQSEESVGEYPEEVTVEMITDTDGYSYVCRPAGKGPFPSVLYSHGGLGTAIGGDLEGTCIALAEAGYLARAEKRDTTISLAGHLGEVLIALDSLISHEDANADKIGIMGFSRGGLLTLQAGILRNDQVHAILLLSPAPGAYDSDSLTTLHTALEQVSDINAPVLVLVPENDLYQANHVQLAYDVKDSLEAAVKDVFLILYSPYDADEDGITFFDLDSDGVKDEDEGFDADDDGHELFWEVQEPYWSDVLEFLDEKIGE